MRSRWPLKCTVYRKPKLLMPPPETDSSVFTVESVMPTSDESPRRGSHSSVDRELLIRNVLEAMGTRRDIVLGRRRNTELEQLLRDATHVGSVMIQETSSPASLPGGGGGACAWTTGRTVISVSLDMG